MQFSGSTYSSHTQTVDGKEIQCKVMSGSYDAEMGIDYGLVSDGTKCGNQRMCMNRTCIDMQQYATYTRCPVDANNVECSGLGKEFRLFLLHTHSGLWLRFCTISKLLSKSHVAGAADIPLQN